MCWTERWMACLAEEHVRSWRPCGTVTTHYSRQGRVPCLLSVPSILWSFSDLRWMIAPTITDPSCGDVPRLPLYQYSINLVWLKATI